MTAPGSAAAAASDTATPVERVGAPVESRTDVTVKNEEAVLKGKPKGQHAHSGPYWARALGSVGVVFGDIGTSPLYAFNAAIGQAMHDQLGRNSILGVVSLALWALIIVVTIKYVLFVMRADKIGRAHV